MISAWTTAPITATIVSDTLTCGAFVQSLAAWLLVLSACCLMAWIPLAPALGQTDSPRICFQGRFACGALTRFTYDSQGQLRYVALTAELHDEPCGEGEGRAGRDGTSTQLLAAVHFVEYSETGEGTRTVVGYAVGSGGAFEPAGAEIRLPLDLFESTVQERSSVARESFLGSAQIAVQLCASGPLQYGPCQMIWHAPMSTWQLDSTGSRQAICSIEAEIDGNSLPTFEQNSVTGILLTGAGWFEKQWIGPG